MTIVSEKWAFHVQKSLDWVDLLLKVFSSSYLAVRGPGPGV